MLLSILTIILIAILFLALWRNEGDLSAPSIIFTAGFVFCAFWALAYAAKWNYAMRMGAFCVIAGGVILFVLACGATKKLVFRGKDWQEASGRWDGQAPTWCILAFLLLQAIVGLWFVLRVRQMYPAGSVSASIAAYKEAATFTTKSIYLGFPLSPLRVVCLSAAYVFGYSFVIGLQDRRKSVSTILLGLTVLANLVLNWEGGGRTGIAVYAAYVIVLFMLMQRERNEGRLALSKKQAIALVCLGVAFVAAFRLMAIGRHEGFSLQALLDNLSAYCGAEIPNLDYWMRSSRGPANDVWGSMTFIRTINYVGQKLGISRWVYPLDLPFVWSGWHWLGNVYTTFYAFLYDFGPIGLVVLTIVMGCISEAVYCMSGRAKKFRDIWMMTYAYLAPQLFLSFFSNKFYEEFLTISFARTLLIILFVRIALIILQSHKIRIFVDNHIKRKSASSHDALDSED